MNENTQNGMMANPAQPPPQQEKPVGWEDSTIKKFVENEYALMDKKWQEQYDKETDEKRRESLKANKEYGKVVHDCVTQLLKLMFEQGHSELSAGFTLAEFSRLSKFKPLSPLTGEDDEWQDVYENNGKTIQQNKRCFSIFREKGDNSTAENSEGVAFSDDEGKTWYTNSHSRVKVSFPYSVPDEIARKIITKEEKEAMDKADEEAWNAFIKEHPEYVEKLRAMRQERPNVDNGEMPKASEGANAN